MRLVIRNHTKKLDVAWFLMIAEGSRDRENMNMYILSFTSIVAPHVVSYDYLPRHRRGRVEGKIWVTFMLWFITIPTSIMRGGK